jgi:hypothetical protein
MPHVSRIAYEALLFHENGTGPLVRVQATTGQPAAGGDSDARPVPPGTERVEGAFEILGLMIAGLIVLFAVVLLVMRARRNR